MKQANKIGIGVRFTEAQLSMLRKIGMLEGVPVSEIIRVAVVREINRWHRRKGNGHGAR